MRFFLKFIQVFSLRCRNQKYPKLLSRFIMRSHFPSINLATIVCTLGLSLVAMSAATTYAAEDSSPSKPIKEAPEKSKSGEASDNVIKSKSKSSEKSTEKSSEKSSEKGNSKAAAAQRDKEELDADVLADKIAKKMAELRKESERKAPPPPAMRRSEPKPVQRAASITNPSAGQPHGSNLAGDAMLIPHDVHWSYEGEGSPLRWGKIDPANAKCDTGERQSPIDIRDTIRVDLEPVQFDYKPVRFNVIDTGHTIQVNLGAGNSITILGRRYDLMQFHFHKPSEERINGRNYEMVAHMVHKDVDGKIVVVAILIEQGKAHSLIQTVWNNMPLEKNDTVQPSGTIDMNQILPKDRQYFTYMGSLTTPPCTEGVLWVVIKEPIEVSQDQISIFSRLYPMNARPIQNSAGRLIKESN